MDQHGNLTVVGTDQGNVDGYLKSTGQAVYGTDFALPGMLIGKYLRSQHPHAKILNIDTARAEKLKGVRAVTTGRDYPKRFGLVLRDQNFMAVDRVRYVGEPVVGVAAVDLDTALEALDLIHVEYEPMPAVLDSEESLKEDAFLIHPELGDYQVTAGFYPVAGTNIANHFKIRTGNVDDGFAQSDIVYEGTYTTPAVHHVYLEPNAHVAQFTRDGRLNLWADTQTTYLSRLKLSECLEMPMSKVRVIATYVGGGFGGKHFQAQPETVALAMKTGGVPVKVQFTREESFQGTSLRHPSKVTIRTGVKKDGTLLARKIRMLYDTGAYSERGVMVTKNAGYSSPGPYRVPNVWVDALCVYTNKTVSGAFRGFGIPQVCWAHEVHMEELAEQVGMDPYEFRLKNAFVDGDVTWTGQKLHSVAVGECLEAARESIDWPRKRSSDGRIRRGRGIAAMHKTTVAFSAGATLKINEDGTVNVQSSAVDCGQGSNTMLGQIVAEELGVKPEAVVMGSADTDIGPFDWGTAASRVTFILGPAIKKAAIDAREQLLERAAEQLEARPEDLFIHDGMIRFKSDPDKGMGIPDVLMGNHRQGGKGTPIMGVGAHNNETTPLDKDGHGAKPTPFWMHAAQAADVEVDIETGDVVVTKLVGAHDVGKAINPISCVAQIEGALATGLGYALSEELQYDGGECINPNLADYKIPTALDCPPYDSLVVEVPHDEGPYGAKGLGEPGLAPTAAAIANAVYDACGVRIHDLPLTAEKVYAEIQRMKAEGKEI